MFELVRKTFRGEFGLPRTFWVVGLGIYYFFLVTPLSFLISKVLVPRALDGAEGNLIVINAIQILIAIATIFVGTSIIRSTSFERDRGFLGWLTIMFVLGFISFQIRLVLVNFNLIPSSEYDFERAIDMSNANAPHEVSDGYTFLGMERTSDNAVRIFYSLEVNQVDTKLKPNGPEELKEDCQNFGYYFDFVEKLYFNYTGSDGTNYEEVLVKEQC